MTRKQTHEDAIAAGRRSRAISEAEWERKNNIAGRREAKNERQCSGCGVAISLNETGLCLVCSDIADARAKRL